MSRFELPTRPMVPHATGAAIGWDRPLRTFFVQVFAFNTAEAEEQAIVWLGTAPGELPTAAAAIEQLRPYCDIPDDLAARLEVDRLKTLGHLR